MREVELRGRHVGTGKSPEGGCERNWSPTNPWAGRKTIDSSGSWRGTRVSASGVDIGGGA
jgi:hypothetical protein